MNNFLRIITNRLPSYNVIIVLCFLVCIRNIDLMLTVDYTTEATAGASDPWMEMMNGYMDIDTTDNGSNDEMIRLPIIDERKECFPLSKHATKGVVRLNLTQLMYSQQDYMNEYHRMKNISDFYSFRKNSQQYKLFNKIGKYRWRYVTVTILWYILTFLFIHSFIPSFNPTRNKVVISQHQATTKTADEQQEETAATNNKKMHFTLST